MVEYQRNKVDPVDHRTIPSWADQPERKLFLQIVMVGGDEYSEAVGMNFSAETAADCETLRRAS
jgi:hypothetical protein